MLSRRLLGVLRPQLIHSVVLAGLLAGCAYLPGGGTATPLPSVEPSATPSLAQIDHPTGATDVVLRYGYGGGLVPMGFLFTEAPQFTLYGDGTVVFQAPAEGSLVGSAKPLPAWRTGKLSEEAVQELLRFALNDGGLRAARASYDNPYVADASTTYFNINADGLEKVVSVYALGLVQPDDRDAEARTALAELADSLADFGRHADAATLSDVVAYDPRLYRVAVFDGYGEPVGEVAEWPWDDISLDDFPVGDEPGRTKVLTRAQVARLTDVPNGGQLGLWVAPPTGSPVTFAVRPLLPDEIAAYEEAAADPT